MECRVEEKLPLQLAGDSSSSSASSSSWRAYLGHVLGFEPDWHLSALWILQLGAADLLSRQLQSFPQPSFSLLYQREKICARIVFYFALFCWREGRRLETGESGSAAGPRNRRPSASGPNGSHPLPTQSAWQKAGAIQHLAVKFGACSLIEHKWYGSCCWPGQLGMCKVLTLWPLGLPARLHEKRLHSRSGRINQLSRKNKNSNCSSNCNCCRPELAAFEVVRTPKAA